MRVRREPCLIGLVMVLLACVPGKTMGSVERTELRGEELNAAVAALQRSEELRRLTAGAQDTRMYLVSSSKYTVSETGSAERRLAEVVYFRYEGGITIRGTVDLATNEVLKLERLEAYPTPLAEEERAEAIRLAREQSDAVRALYASAGNDVEIDLLVPVIANPQDPRYGHRLVVLMFAPPSKPEAVVKVEVDLTLRTVRPSTPGSANGSSGEAQS